jgi:hypothetical protein
MFFSTLARSALFLDHLPRFYCQVKEAFPNPSWTRAMKNPAWRLAQKQRSMIPAVRIYILTIQKSNGQQTVTQLLAKFYGSGTVIPVEPVTHCHGNNMSPCPIMPVTMTRFPLGYSTHKMRLV